MARATDRYDNVRIGMNGRLDTIQAAVLIEKLKIFPEEIVARDRVARRYNAALGRRRDRAAGAERHSSVWAQYTIRVPGGRRDALAAPCARRASRPHSTIRTATGRAPTATIRWPRAGLPVTEGSPTR